MTGELTLTHRLPLKKPDGSPLSGLPNINLSANANQPYNDEVPVDFNFVPLGTLDPLGGGLEGMMLDAGAGNDEFTVTGQPLPGGLIDLLGGANDDTYALGASNTRIRVTDSAGTDTLDFTPAPAGVTVNLARPLGQVQHIDILGNKLQLVGAIENVLGSAFNDVLSGNGGPNDLSGMDGDDILDGAGGDDYLDGGDGNDRLQGGGGNNILLGRDGNDLLLRGAGRDLAIGGAGRDLLFGQGDGDILLGGSTVHDNDRAALEAILSVWTSPLPFDERVQNLSAGLLAASNLVDDLTADLLFGAANLHWLLP